MPAGGSRPHVVVDTAEVLGLWGGGVYQREERDSNCSQLPGSGEEFCGQNFWTRGTTSSRWGGMKPRFGSTSGSERRKTRGSIN